MTTAFQSVIKDIKKVTLKFSKTLTLHVGLLITTLERKNYSAMARSANLSYQKVFINSEDAKKVIPEIQIFLVDLIKKCDGLEKKGALLVDFTMLEKQYSEKIEGVTYDFNGVGKRVSKGFSAGFICWSNGVVNIPFNFTLWLRKKDAPELYKNKTELAKELISHALELEVPFAEVKLDGAFANPNMIEFLTKKKIGYSMRIPKNRRIESDGYSGQICNHPGLQLKKNEKYKTIKATYRDFECYITTEKRNGNKGKKEVVFIVSNVDQSPKEHVNSYAKRWPVEKCFRTSKQSLGLIHCQSTNSFKQQAHVFLVMALYSILQVMKFAKQKRSVEEVLNGIRRQKQLNFLREYIDWKQTINH